MSCSFLIIFLLQSQFYALTAELKIQEIMNSLLTLRDTALQIENELATASKAGFIEKDKRYLTTYSGIVELPDFGANIFSQGRRVRNHLGELLGITLHYVKVRESFGDTAKFRFQMTLSGKQSFQVLFDIFLQDKTPH